MEGFGPVHAEVGRDRIKAADQISAQENLHGDSVWMLWHVGSPPRMAPRYTQRWLYLHGCIGEPDEGVFGRGEPTLQSNDRLGQGHRTGSARSAAQETLRAERGPSNP